MTRPLVIDVDEVSLAYDIYRRPTDLMKELLFGGMHHDRFWALRGVSLKVFEGERVGIIGPNGAGKSTLLKVICGTLQPSTGSVRTMGSISSLLSMVPAWNEDDTGIENIKYNLTVRGVPSTSIPALIDDIIDFTELGQFIFHPVRTYSSGMSARLSFAIATACEPEILIIDEVLGTGDGYFAWKAMKRMQDFCARGRAIIFVSHSMAAVQQMCDRAIWMQNGSVRLEGEVNYVLKQYELDFRRSEDEAVRTPHATKIAERGGRAFADEVVGEHALRLRIIPKAGGRFAGTHFVRAITVEWSTGERIDVPLELVNQAHSATALDLLSSEWGRLQEREGHICRILQRTTGRNFGGQFVVQEPAAASLTNPRSLLVSVELCDDRPRDAEGLALEMLDLRAGRWLPVEAHGVSACEGTWRRAVYSVRYEAVEPQQRETLLGELREEDKPDAEIVCVDVMVPEGETTVVREEEPFELRVKVRFNRSPDLADTSIKITRMDGVYVFWQSSGQSGANVKQPKGERTFRFLFDPNEFGAGQYAVNAYVANGWRYPENYPYSEVFARAIDAVVFRVVPRMSDLDFGVLNKRVPVVVE